MAPAGNMAKRLSSVNYTTKTIHHHHYHHHHHHHFLAPGYYVAPACKRKKEILLRFLCAWVSSLTFSSYLFPLSFPLWQVRETPSPVRNMEIRV